MRKRRQLLSAMASIAAATGLAGCPGTSDDDPENQSSVAGDTATPTDEPTATKTPDNNQGQNTIPPHDHSGPDAGGNVLRPGFVSAEREPGRVLLTEFVSGAGTWEDPYTAPSGTAGLSEVVDEYGPHTTIFAPKGVYSFTAAFETTASDFRIVGEGSGHPEHDPSSDEEPRNTIFRLDYRPDDPRKGAIIHAKGSQESGADSMIFGWQLENFRLINGTAESWGKERATATAMRVEWFPVNRVARVTVGGPYLGQGFDRGILTNNMFKFTWSDIWGKKNRVLVDSDGDVNQGIFRGIYGKPEDNNGKPGAMLWLRDDIGRVPNLAAAKPRGLAIVGVGGDAASATYGIVLEGAFGVDIFQPHIERCLGSAVVVDVTDDEVLSRSVGLYSGFFHNNRTAIEVRGGRRVLVDGPYIQTPGREGTTAIAVGEKSEHTRLRRLSVHESVKTPVADDGVGTTRNGMGHAPGATAPPPSDNWEPGDTVEVTEPTDGEPGVYQLMTDGERWRRLG